MISDFVYISNRFLGFEFKEIFNKEIYQYDSKNILFHSLYTVVNSFHETLQMPSSLSLISNHSEA